MENMLEYKGKPLVRSGNTLYYGNPAESPRTEHEEMFAAQGIPIKYLIAHPPEETR